ncbi:hypothetical protein NLI96_g9406 [Meripilus lineatus]|uniref:F-box domain-containing protein n=1 Tax=Meripilus lineatus TaxID=2056292 RepID=A0AAD5UX86_9APHY|nr:hypothetical protein NLI96_g9406 [Physisporinus lineatus]
MVDLTALVAPMQYLPDELLATIFQVASRERSTGPDWRYQSSKQLPVPMVISSVSRRWRHVALTTPGLWAHIRVPIWRPRNWPRFALERSGTHPIDVILDYRNHQCPTADSIQTTLSLVLPHVQRWNGFTLIADHGMILKAIGQQLADLHCPTLRDLRFSLTGRGTQTDQHVTIPRIFSGGAPHLTHVRVDSVALAWSSPSLTGLTTLDLRWLWSDTKLSYDQFQILVLNSPGLTTLILRGCYVQLSPTNQYPIIQTPALRHLEISGDSVCGMLWLLDTPALQSLVLANVDEGEFRELGQSLQTTTRRSRYPSLRSLTLLNVSTSQPTEGFLEVLSTITDLTIINSASDGFVHVLRAHSCPNGTYKPPAFPQLRCFTLLHDVDMETLFDVVENRARHGCPLRRLVVYAGSLNEQYKALFQQYLTVDGVYYRTEDQ